MLIWINSQIACILKRVSTFLKSFLSSISPILLLKFQIRDRVGPPAGREIFQVEALELEETVEVAKTRRCC